MKKCFVLTVLIAAIAVGQSESQRVGISPKMDVPSPVVQGSREPSPEDAKRRWVDKMRGVFSGKRDKVGHGRTEDDGRSVSEMDVPNVVHVQAPPTPLESEYLKEIALVLSIHVSKDDTPGDIAFKIKQCIGGNAERYRGEVLSDESFEKARSAIRIPADAETFAGYHQFIKKIDGKRIIVLDSKEKQR